MGLGLLVVWVGALQLILDLGKEHEWFASPMIVGLAIVSAVGFAAFLIWELTEANPIVSLKVFRYRGFWVSVITVAVGYAAFMATNVLTPNWLQRNMGYTATWAGVACGLVGVLAIPVAPIAAKLSAKVDVRKIVFVGLCWMAAITCFRSGMTSQVSFGQIAVLMLLMGVGMPLFFLPLNTLALSSVSPEETAAAAGLLNFARTLSGAIGVSVVNTVWEDGWSRNQSELSGLLNGGQHVIDGFMSIGASHVQATNALAQMVLSQAVMISTNQLMAASAAAFLAAAALIWLAPKPARVEAAGFGH